MALRSQPELVELTDEMPEQAWDRYRRSGMAELIGAYHLCQVLYAAEQLGLNTLLRTGRSFTVDQLPPQLRSELGVNLIRYLVVRGIIKQENEQFRITDHGQLLLDDIASAQLGFYLEAYGPVTSCLKELLDGSRDYGNDVLRNGEALGRHCATLFETFHTATVQEALRGMGAKYLLDLGCGGGRFLVDACLRDSTLRGVGLDISEGAINFAKQLSCRLKTQDRLDFVVGDAFKPETWPDVCRKADALCAVGVIHEHFRDGEQAVISILDQYAELLRTGSIKGFILGEPELYYDDEENDSDLFLVHIFTKQGFPRRRERWLDIFPKTQLRCRRLFRRPNAGPRFTFFDLVPV